VLSLNLEHDPKGAYQAILGSRFYFLTVKEGVAHCNHPNLKSVEEDKPLVYHICKYLISGALECCPSGFRSTNLVPCGLVPNKNVDETFCVLADGQHMTEYMFPGNDSFNRHVRQRILRVLAGFYLRVPQCVVAHTV